MSAEIEKSDNFCLFSRGWFDRAIEELRSGGDPALVEAMLANGNRNATIHLLELGYDIAEE